MYRGLAARPAPKRAAGGGLQAGGVGSRCARAKCRCVLALQAASEPALAYADHNVYTFAEATAPHLAAHDEGRTIEPARLSAGLAQWRARADVVLVEGAGGWRTPLNGQIDFADWVAAEKLPVLLVVGMRLGCINHALLTVQAVQQAGLPLAGWVANIIDPKTSRLEENLATLAERIPAPCLGRVPKLKVVTAEAVAEHLQLDLLD